MLFLSIIMPPLVVGLLKAKYTIYAGVMLAIAIGFTLSAADDLLSERFKALIKDAGNEKISLGLLVLAALLVLQFVYHGMAPSLLLGAFQTLYQNNPAALAPKFQAMCTASNDSEVCAAAANPMGYASNGTNSQYSEKLCDLSIFSNYSYLNDTSNAPPWEVEAVSYRCQRLADYWVSSMEWIRNSTPNGSRIMSWWDYGHWINFFGQRNAVIRNEQASQLMIGEVAYEYLDGTPEELASYMKNDSIGYALFDIELISSGSQLGGKYGALNYLACAYLNQTDVTRAPGESQCEADHLWETIFVSQNPCTISTISNKTGLLAYKMYYDVFKKDVNGQVVLDSNGMPIILDTVYQPYYTTDCENPTDPGIINYCKTFVKAVPAYCVGSTVLANGQTTYATFDLNQTYPNGDLKLNKAILEYPYSVPQTSHFGPATAVTLFYTNDMIWLENGVVTSGYADRKGDFYDSNIYHALFFDNITGFNEAYTNGAVKIFTPGG